MRKSVCIWLLILFLAAPPAFSQTFRGAINGMVTDPSGGAVLGAKIMAIDKATGVEHSTVTTSDGQFAFQDLPVGTYRVKVAAQGFPELNVDNVPVAQGAIYTLPAKLEMSQQLTTVEVSAAALALDTTTSTQTTLVGGGDLQSLPLNGRDFTQLIAATPGFGGYSAGGYGSLNGTRANQINWQIDGVDNNDLWHNIPAVNQGGVSGIAGIVLPIDAVDQFSVQTQAAPESGRNPGGTVDLALKSGGNQFHGSVYDYMRNEAFAAASPFVTTKGKNRNYNYGYSFGGPFLKDKLFFFTTFEKQRFTIGLPGKATEPSQAYQTQSQQLLNYYKVANNTVTAQLLSNLWPSYALNGAASANNYNSPDPEYGYSYNGLAKVDYQINSKNSLSFHYFVGQGNQIAPVGGSALSQAASELKYYYEAAPIHVQNYALVWNSTLTPSLTNQVLAGVNYFHQVFNDFNNGFVVANYGLLLSPSFNLTGAPNIQISGFDGVGLTPPEGREDITGHLTDVVSYTVGRHQFRFGGEFRRAQLEEFYHRHGLGSFTFDGTKGPWYSDYKGCAGFFAGNAACNAGTYDYNILTLADFLSGDVSRSSIALGDPTRLVFVKTFNLFAQDAWQINRKLTFNYGLRWDYEGPLGNDKKNLSVFRPPSGIVFQGSDISSIYSKQYKNFSPRLGLAYQPKAGGDLVIRAGFGIYFDTPNLNPFLDNRPANGAPNGVEGNPAGPTPVDTVKLNSYTIAPNQYIFPAGGATCPTGNVATSPNCGSTVFNVFSVSKDFRNAYNYNYNLNVEKGLGKALLLQVGYVGSAAHRLLTTLDINQLNLSTGLQPYAAAFPNFGVINEIHSNGNSNYNSLQTVLKVREWHHFTGQFTYTWAHALDDMTAYRGTLPQDSYNLRGDYGNSDFDTRHNFTALLAYQLPNGGRWKLLTNGWELSSLLSLHTGQPFTVFASSDTSGTGEGVQRANQVGDPFKGVSHAFNIDGVQWVNPAAFVDPPQGTFGTSPRNGYYGPGYADVDFSVVKNTKVTERINTQFRMELFNLFNRTNLAPPNGSLGGGFGSSSDTIGDYNGAPGIGPGEAFNLQLALKIIF